MRRFCEELNISIWLLFTEAGHGKSPCDGVGGNTKTQFEAIALDIHGNKEALSIHNADDVAKLLKERSNLTYDISVHKQDKTDQIRRSIGKLSSLVGAQKIHEILINQNLVVKKKNLPNDPFYKSVLIKESRRKSTISNDSDSGSEFDDIVDSDD